MIPEMKPSSPMVFVNFMFLYMPYHGFNLNPQPVDTMAFLRIFWTPRLGPSASEVHHDKLEALVKSLSHIQSVLEDPAMREVIGNVAPQLLNLDANGPKNSEVKDAEDGKPASSRPGKTPKTCDMPPPPPPKTAKVNDTDKTDKTDMTDKSIDVDKSPESIDKSASQDPPSGEGEVNSSTHRAAHARLVRRMEKVAVADFPHMSKLWAGGRKDARYNVR